MTDEFLIWHYGLMAECWAEFSNDAREAPFFLQEIARAGQPVLDVSCGTGRVLLPLLRAGIDIDGVDISADMLGHCRRKAAAEGFSPNLYQQPMQAFDLPRKYRTIYICDLFGLAGSRANDLETLRRCYQHLEDGGALLVNIEAEYTSPDTWDGWLSARRKTLPEAWPEEGRRRIAADGSEYIDRFRYLDIDPLEQSFTRAVRLEKWQAGVLVAAEEYTLRGNVYMKNELLLMLEVAGFREITVRGDYTEAPATPDSEELVFQSAALGAAPGCPLWKDSRRSRPQRFVKPLGSAPSHLPHHHRQVDRMRLLFDVPEPAAQSIHTPAGAACVGLTGCAAQRVVTTLTRPTAAVHRPPGDGVGCQAVRQRRSQGNGDR